MASGNFARWWAFCQRSENDGQGLHDTPGDTGGWTNRGITFATYQDDAPGLGMDPSFDAFKVLTQDGAGQIAKARFWDPIRADEMPPGADLIWADFHFTSEHGTRQLQSLLGVLADNEVGPVTLDALRADWTTGPSSFLEEMTTCRISYYESLGEAEFIRGWTRRANDCAAEAALLLVSAAG